LFGRKRRIPEALKIPKIYGDMDHEELPYDARGILNLACNHRIQSTGASICNRAMIAFHNVIKDLGLDAKIVSQVHDEIIVECSEKNFEDVKNLLEYCMVNTVSLKGMELEAVPRVTKTLAK
jgi:DNA polymerase I-like protein with 3'-5' exonuclease and polymerase domains